MTSANASAYSWLLLTMLGCGGGGRAPIDVVRGEVARLCGAQDLGNLTAPGPGGGRLEGCMQMVEHGDGGWHAKARLHFGARAEELLGVSVELIGSEANVQELRRKAMRIVAPILDDRGERTVRDALERVYRVSDVKSEFGPTAPHEFEAGPMRVAAYTGLDIDEPARRVVKLRLSFVEHAPEDMPDVPESEFASPLGVVTEDVLEAWRALCRDDEELARLLGFPVTDPVSWDDDDRAVPEERWAAGEVWARCRVRHRSIDHGPYAVLEVSWAPASRRVVRFRAIVDHHSGLLRRRGDPGPTFPNWSRFVEPFLAMVTTDDQRRCLLDNGACAGVVATLPEAAPDRAFELRTVDRR